MYICPHCMNSHADSIKQCPEKNRTIPSRFIDDVKRGIPVVYIFTIGPTSHGKTCYLSSFFHTLYHQNISRTWPDFTFDGLTSSTLKDIQEKYVSPLFHNKLPPKTVLMFPEPLIIRFPNMPNRHRGLRKVFFLNTIMPRDVIFVFYDLSGDTFLNEQTVKEYLPIINKVDSLIFLISLPLLIQQVEKGEIVSEVIEMHNLLQVITLAMESNRIQMKRKNLILGFIWADEMWNKEEIYGPLAKKMTQGLPPIKKIPDYLSLLTSHSGEIGHYLSDSYGTFYNLCQEFGSVSSVTVSALGSRPKSDNTINSLAPYHIWDPILMLLKKEGHL